MGQILSQYCINVSDLDRSIDFWEGVMGIPVQSRTEIPIAKEAVLQAKEGGSRMQLAQQLDHEGPIDMGSAMWKLYVNTDDCQAIYDKAIAAGCESVIGADTPRSLAGHGRVHQGLRRLPDRARSSTTKARRPEFRTRSRPA